MGTEKTKYIGMDLGREPAFSYLPKLQRFACEIRSYIYKPRDSRGPVDRRDELEDLVRRYFKGADGR